MKTFIHLQCLVSIGKWTELNAIQSFVKTWKLDNIKDTPNAYYVGKNYFFNIYYELGFWIISLTIGTMLTEKIFTFFDWSCSL